MSDASYKTKWACRLAGDGFGIFPLPPGSKVPDVPWTGVRTTDVGQIRAWFQNQPDMNYGVSPSERHVVLDLDRKPAKPDGVAAMAGIEAAQDISDWITGGTLTVQTPNGAGLHLYMTVPYPVSGSRTGWPAGIDVRAHGNYVVGPGSVFDGRPYTVVCDAPVASAPGWVVGRLRREGAERDPAASRIPIVDLDSPAAVDSARRLLERRPGAVQGAGGDEHTYATALLVRDLGVSEHTCLMLMAEVWNPKCSPEWTVVGDGDTLQTKVRNAYAYGQRSPGAKLVDPSMFGDPGAIGADDVQVIGSASSSRLAAIMSRGRNVLSIRTNREMIVPEWLPAHGMTAVLARRSVGKTVVMLDMALRLASDMDWHGAPMREGWHSVYICGEDTPGTLEQIRAWLRYHEVRAPPDRFMYFDGVVDLMSAGDVEEWARFVRDQIGGAGRAVVFLDTWQRASSRGGQNSDEDMQTAVHHVEALARSVGGPAVVAFHPPKSEQATKIILGHSVMENSTTAILTLTAEAAARRLEVTRMKGKGEGNYVLLSFAETAIGEVDDFGRPRTGVVPIKIGGLGDPETAVLNRRLREGLARVIRHLETRRKTEDPKCEHYTFPDLKVRISRVLDVARDAVRMNARDRSPEQDEHAALGQPLFDAGLSAWSPQTMERLLKTCFQDDPRPYEFDDGVTLVYRSVGGRGGKRWFELVGGLR